MNAEVLTFEMLYEWNLFIEIEHKNNKNLGKTRKYTNINVIN